MRILWHSNSPNAASGYGVQTNLAVSRLQGTHQFAISCNYGQEGFTSAWQTPGGDVPLFPKDGRVDDHGEGIMPYHAQAFGAEAIITHYDAWVFDPSKHGLPWIPWYPIDCEEVPVSIASRIQHAAMRITQTRHAVDRTERLGMDAEYVPAAFDGSSYYPREAVEMRETLGVTGKYMVACVAANSGHPASPSRKSYPQIFEGFKQFLSHQPNAVLYVHTHQRGQVNLGTLAEQHGLEEHVIGATPYYLATNAYAADDMAKIYSAADVLLSPSMGEGFGVPIVEAQACGTPVITGDWTSMSEITRTGRAIPKDEAMPYPVVGYGTQYLVRPESVRDALIESTKWKHDPADVSARVQEYEISHVIKEHWQPTLVRLEQRLKQPAAPALNRAARRRLKLADKQAVA